MTMSARAAILLEGRGFLHERDAAPLRRLDHAAVRVAARALLRAGVASRRPAHRRRPATIARRRSRTVLPTRVSRPDALRMAAPCPVPVDVDVRTRRSRRESEPGACRRERQPSQRRRGDRREQKREAQERQRAEAQRRDHDRRSTEGTDPGGDVEHLSIPPHPSSARRDGRGRTDRRGRRGRAAGMTTSDTSGSARRCRRGRKG